MNRILWGLRKQRREDALELLILPRLGRIWTYKGDTAMKIREKDEMIHSLAKDTVITVWWEKPYAAPAKYEVYVDGERTCETEKTHASIENLEPDTTYRICIEPMHLETEVRTGIRKRRIDVTAAPYHAKGDGETLNTRMLQKALDDCGAGDAVYLPAGIYLTGALRLHSDMELYLEEGAVLQGTECIEDYLPRIPSRFEGTERECYSSLLNLGHMDHKRGADCENVLIHGRGTISGGGAVLARKMIEDERERLKDYIASLGVKVKECENDDTIPGRVRPRLINMSNCRNVRISGLTLQNGPCWNVHMIYSDSVTTDHCIFRSEKVWNGDGWDPDSSANCTLFACTFYTGDDAVAIKSGKNPEGNIINRPCEYIRIFDCYSAFGHGICMGSEMSGGIRDVRIWDCDLRNSLCGLEIKGTRKRGGYVRDIFVRDCRLPRIQVHSVGYNDDGIGAEEPPVFEHFVFEGIYLTGRYYGDDRSYTECPAVSMEGFEEEGHEVKDVLLKDLVLAPGALQKIQVCCCEGIRVENLSTSREV